MHGEPDSPNRANQSAKGKSTYFSHHISKFVLDRSGQISPCLVRYAVAQPDEVHPAWQGEIWTLNIISEPLHQLDSARLVCFD